jgi:hypothetical protein
MTLAGRIVVFAIGAGGISAGEMDCGIGACGNAELEPCEEQLDATVAILKSKMERKFLVNMHPLRVRNAPLEI